MRRTALLWLASLLVVGACAPHPGGMVEETDVSLFRGVKLLPKGGIDWSEASFGVSGKPPTLSFFNTMDGGGMPCWLEIVAVGPDEVKPGVTAELAIPDPPGKWSVLFDNDPAGHWSIARDTIGGDSNRASGKIAAAVFAKMAKEGTAEVRNGTSDDCAPPG